jgi:hypothetical protein
MAPRHSRLRTPSTFRVVSEFITHRACQFGRSEYHWVFAPEGVPFLSHPRVATTRKTPEPREIRRYDNLVPGEAEVCPGCATTPNRLPTAAEGTSLSDSLQMPRLSGGPGNGSRGLPYVVLNKPWSGLNRATSISYLRTNSQKARRFFLAARAAWLIFPE